jgi:hypothetical protein
MESKQSRFGDFGLGGRPSEVSDDWIDTEKLAKEAAKGEWEYQAHTSNIVGWHIPGDTAFLNLKRSDHGWKLERGKRPVSGRDPTLQEGIESAAGYMKQHPSGERGSK